jgi:hypothetical protein
VDREVSQDSCKIRRAAGTGGDTGGIVLDDAVGGTKKGYQKRDPALLNNFDFVFLVDGQIAESHRALTLKRFIGISEYVKKGLCEEEAPEERQQRRNAPFLHNLELILRVDAQVADGNGSLLLHTFVGRTQETNE